METILLRAELKRFYLKFIEKIKDFETHPKHWADGISNIAIAKVFCNKYNFEIPDVLKTAHTIKIVLTFLIKKKLERI